MDGHHTLDAGSGHLPLQVLDRARARRRAQGVLDHRVAGLVEAIDMRMGIGDRHLSLLPEKWPG